MKLIAWYDPTNDVVSTDKDSPLFTPLGQVWPLYLQSEREPIGYASEGAAERLTTVKQAHEQIRSFRLFTHDVALYTAPQRPWVGLTDEEIWTVLQFRGYNTDTIEFARAIEAKLKEKNNG